MAVMRSGRRRKQSWEPETRRGRVTLNVVLMALCIGYVIWWAIDRKSFTSVSPVRSWFSVCAATVFFFVLLDRIHTEYEDPERAERQAGERGARAAQDMSDFKDWGIKVMGVAIALIIGGLVIADHVWNFGGLTLVVIGALLMAWRPRKRPRWAGGPRPFT